MFASMRKGVRMMKPNEALQEIQSKVFRNTDDAEIKMSKDCYKTIITALEKQIPKKYELFNGQCCCPACNKLFGSYTQLKNLIHWEMPYCKFCGQALDWSENKS